MTYPTIPNGHIAGIASDGKNLWIVDANSNSIYKLNVKVIVSDIDNFRIRTIPEAFHLNQNYPNPFNPSTKIKFLLPKSETVEIDVYNAIGQWIKTLLNQKLPAGQHELEFNASDLASGLYYYRISAGDFTDIKKMVLLK